MQVLDDSTCAATRQLVDEKVLEWRERGVCVTCVRRTNRQGYKAGALKEVRDSSRLSLWRSSSEQEGIKLQNGVLPEVWSQRGLKVLGAKISAWQAALQNNGAETAPT